MNDWMEIWVFAFRKRMLVLYLLSVSAIAGSLGNDGQIWDVTTDCLMDSWGIEGHALLLKANSTALDIPQKVTTSTGEVEYGTKPTWKWGFQVGARYIWNTGNDFVWSWSNYRNNDIQSILSKPAILGTVVKNYRELLPSSLIINDVLISKAIFKTTYEWDQINFEFGQSINLPVRVKMRPQAGLQIARIANYLNSGFGSSSEYENTLYSSRASTMFNGAGPRTGFELRWESDWGLSVYGRGNLGLMYGPAKNNEYIKDYVTDGVTIYNSAFLPIVPTLDTQLGAVGQFDIAQGLLNIDFGWQWNSYRGALMQTAFDIQGLFFGVQWQGTLA